MELILKNFKAAEAEAAREARAKVIVAEGEQKASRALKEAAEVIAQSPNALQLRYLQTLNSIAAEKNSTIGKELLIYGLILKFSVPAPYRFNKLVFKSVRTQTTVSIIE